MNNWERIIEGYSKKPDNQTMKLITATVTSVTNDFYRADVRLITGQEISNLINQTPNKLHVGQNVEVGYRTTPEAGWIQIAHGEPDPMRQGGGGVQVETAAVLDANNVHQWTAEQELILDINPDTKLLYGGNQKTVALQGYCCRYTTAQLDSSNADLFGSKIEIDSWYREASTTFSLKHYVIELYVNERSGSSYTFGLTVSRYAQNSQIAEVVGGYTTTAVSNPTDAFVLLQVTGVSFASDFSTSWGGITDTVSTPYGYVQCDKLRIQVGTLTASSPDTVTFPSLYSGSTVINNLYLNGTGTVLSSEAYRCVPIESLAEKCFDLALTQRSEPIGGGE